MADDVGGEQPTDRVIHLASIKKEKRRRERGRIWEGLWRLWPQDAYRPWDARPYDFDTYTELRRRGRSTR